MDAVPITLAILVLCSTVVGFVLAELASDLKTKSQILKHNVNHALTPILLELDRINEGLTNDTEKAKILLKATRAWLNPIGEQEISLKAYIKPLVASYGMIEFYPLADPLVKVDVGELYAITINCVQNAMEARQAALVGKTREQIVEDQITIKLDTDQLSISNPATQEDRDQILCKGGSTRGEGRGQGIGSIRESCARIGWGVGWRVAGTRAVVTFSFA